jgi:hypothetical protein
VGVESDVSILTERLWASVANIMWLIKIIHSAKEHIVPLLSVSEFTGLIRVLGARYDRDEIPVAIASVDKGNEHLVTLSTFVKSIIDEGFKIIAKKTWDVNTAEILIHEIRLCAANSTGGNTVVELAQHNMIPKTFGADLRMPGHSGITRVTNTDLAAMIINELSLTVATPQMTQPYDSD